MITIDYDPAQSKKLEQSLGNKSKRLPREIATAINATARKTRSQMSKSVREELATTKKAVDATISVRGKASPQQLGSSVRLSQTRRIPLRDFGARQNRAGVAYKISKRGGRKLATSAFQGPKPGVMKATWKGRVFRRVGAARLPIVQLFGASPWGVFQKRKLTAPTVRETDTELRKQIDRRIRFNVLKQSGAI